MKDLRSYYIFIVLILIGTVSNAQDFKKTLADFHSKYQSAEKIRIKMSIDAFDSKTSTRPFYQDKVTIAKHGTAYRYKLTETEMLMNDKYIIVVDHSNRQVSMNTRDVRREKEFYKHANFNLDGALQFYDEGTYEGTVSGVSHFSIAQKSGEVQKIDLFFQEQTGKLQQINYLYRAGHWVTISMEEFDLSPTFDENEFNENQFVLKEGRSWKPTVALARYHVLNAN